MDINLVELDELRLLLKKQKELWYSAQILSVYSMGGSEFYYKYLQPLETKLEKRFAVSALRRRRNTIPLLLCVPPKAIASRKQYEMLGFEKNASFRSYIKYVYKITDIQDAPSEDPYLLINVDMETLANVSWGDAFGKFPLGKTAPLLNFAEGLMVATAVGRGIARVQPRNQVAMLRSTYMGTAVPYVDFGVAGMVVLNFVDWNNFKVGTRAAAYYEAIVTKQ